MTDPVIDTDTSRRCGDTAAGAAVPARRLRLLVAVLGVLVTTACATPAAPSPEATTTSASHPAAPLPTATPPDVARSGSCHASDGGFLPDRLCTAGAVDPRVSQGNIANTICTGGYTATVRPPASVTEPIKRARMAAYGITAPLAEYELDHLIPLQLGGSSTVANLWPEPRDGPRGAQRKDDLESSLRGQVCSGMVPLAVAQLAIASDWETAYQTFLGPLPSSAAEAALTLPWSSSPEPASSSRTVRAVRVMRLPEARSAISAASASPPIQVAT